MTAVQGAADAPDATRAERSERAASATFFVAVAIAAPLLLYWGRRTWFVIDDWDFLALRTGGSVDDLFRSHAGHWTTLPIAVYRSLWSLVGIRSYGAYVSVLIVVHLTTATLLRNVIRRGEVDPWLATAFAAVFVFFGSGAANIVVAFQITFAGSLAFGFAHLLLALHSGPVGRRDGLGVLCGLAALMCSGLGIAMVVAVGVATLLRRGYRVALVHLGPLVIAYLVWFAAFGRDGAPRVSGLSASGSFRFAVQSVEAAFGGLGQIYGAGLVYFLMLFAGAALVISRRRVEPVSDGVACALGLLAAAVFFIASTALTRSAPLSGATRAVAAHDPRAGRYVYVIAALALPALALAAQAIVRRWRPAAAVVGAMLLVSFAGNVYTFSLVAGEATVAASVRRHVMTVPRLPMISQVPRSLVVVPNFVPVKTGWLTDAARAGKLADIGSLSAAEISTATLLLMVRPTPTPAGADCRPVRAPARLVLGRGAALVVNRGAATVSYVPAGGARSRSVFVNRGRPVYNLFAAPVSLEVENIPRAGPLQLCVATRPVQRSGSRSR